ncbi:MAG: hypothetical protein RLZZ156_2496 [Deinococcota bacterium]
MTAIVQTLEYYLYGETPVMYIPRRNGDLAVKALDIDNQQFYGDSSFYVDILYDRDGIVKKLTEQEFLLVTHRRTQHAYPEARNSSTVSLKCSYQGR